MKDTYKNFEKLSSVEKKNLDYQIVISNIDSRIAIVAPHGGGIEPGTSEIAKSISGDNFKCYCFEGIKSTKNKEYLHITSTNFDEQKCVEMCEGSDAVVTIHGADKDGDIVFIGGLNESLKRAMIDKLKEDGFNAQEDTTGHSGQDSGNICNKGVLKKGLQLEISKGLRKKMFKGLKRKDRQSTTDIFDKFIGSIRSVLRGQKAE
jgi:phage replication-related protein YjqB (UPF0714/DUF867 family)